MLISHEVALQYQRSHRKHPAQDFAQGIPGTFGHPSGDFPTLSILRGSAVLTLVAGKSLAVLNEYWVLVWSLIIFSNVVDTPYYTTTYFTLRFNGYMQVWNVEPRQFKHTAVQELWSVAIGCSIIFCECVLIYNLTRERERERETETRGHQCRNSIIMLVVFFSIAGSLVYVGAHRIMET
jgi:hypothetical protein